MFQRFPGLLTSVRRWAVFLPLLIWLAGCHSSRNETPDVGKAQKQSSPVRVLVVDDSELAAAIERHLHARSDGDIQIKQLESTELVGQEQKRLRADIVIYPCGLIGELAERSLISPISSDDLQAPAAAQQDIFSLLRLREVAWGEQVFAVPFGSPTLTLYYRADIFSQLGLQPPATWAEFADLARRLSEGDRVGVPEQLRKSWSGVVEPLGAGWAGQVFLARAAASARHRSQYSTLFDSRDMRPLITGPAFVQAMEELAETAKFGSPSSINFTPDDVRREFIAGHCAMALSWPSRAGAASESAGEGVPTAFAELPGASAAYNFRASRWEQKAEGESPHVTLLSIDGRMGSVTRECPQPNDALNLLFLLAGHELAHQVTVESQHTTLFRKSQLEQVNRWVEPELDAQAAQQYGEVLEVAQSRVRSLCSIRIPGRSEYLQALDVAVHDVLAGESDPAEALQQAANRWAEITTALGTERQQTAYLKSIGLEP